MFVSVVKVMGTQFNKSRLQFLATGDNLDKLTKSIMPFSTGKVDVYDLNNDLKAASILPSGRILIRTEYRNDNA